MSLSIIKALHVIFMVCWFAGSFFLGRLLIYAKELPSTEATAHSLIKSGMKRVWLIIIIPSVLLTFLFGLHLMMVTKAYTQPWFHAKFTFILAFLASTLWFNTLRKKSELGPLSISSKKLRMYNEIPAFFLITIVCLVYIRHLPTVASVVGALFLIIGVIVMSALKLTKRS